VVLSSFGIFKTSVISVSSVVVCSSSYSRVFVSIRGWLRKSYEIFLEPRRRDQVKATSMCSLLGQKAQQRPTDRTDAQTQKEQSETYENHPERCNRCSGFP
jgi:hypothetical protein